MTKNNLTTKLAGVVLGAALAGAPGCTTSAGFLNPFEYLTNIVSIDNTSFFVDLYTALIRSGVNVTTETTTDTSTTGTTGTTGMTGMTGTTVPGFGS